MSIIYKVKDQERYVKKLADYSNGILTTGGLYQADELEEADCISVTYNADAAIELPVDWPELLWLDDRDKRLHIKEILFDSESPYIMEDGYASTEVTL